MSDKRYKVLIVEDNLLNCEILQEILEDQYDLLVANNGKEGMDILEKNYSDIDIVLLDIQMPVMNGYEVLKAKADDPILKDIPVIVTTSGEDEIECLKLGAQDFVRKPYNPAVVRLRIANIINLKMSMEANRQKALFIQNMSHEIRTPMNAILGFAQVMESTADLCTPDDLHMFCHSITENSQTLMGMIDNMVALSNYDSGMFVVNPNDIPLNQTCEEAMTSASYSTPEGVKLYFTSDIDDTFALHADAKLLQKVIYNYVVNANKFTQEGEIHVHASDKEKPGSIIVSVSDTGPGVPPEMAEYIFERFTKLNAFVPGIGLGLALARKCADSLGGKAYLDTNNKTGARFILELPVIPLVD